LVVKRWTYDRKVTGSIPGRVAFKQLLHVWMTLFRQVNHLDIWPTAKSFSLSSLWGGKSSLPACWLGLWPVHVHLCQVAG